MGLAEEKSRKTYIEGLTKQLINNQLELSMVNLDAQMEELKAFIESTIDRKLNEYLGKSTPKYFTREEARHYLNISLTTLDKYINSGIIKATRIGKSIRIKSRNLDEALKEIKHLKYKY